MPSIVFSFSVSLNSRSLRSSYGLDLKINAAGRLSPFASIFSSELLEAERLLCSWSPFLMASTVIFLIELMASFVSTSLSSLSMAITGVSVSSTLMIVDARLSIFSMAERSSIILLLVIC